MCGAGKFSGAPRINNRRMQKKGEDSVGVNQEMTMRWEKEQFRKSERREMKLDGWTWPGHKSRNFAFTLRAMGSH